MPTPQEFMMFAGIMLLLTTLWVATDFMLSEAIRVNAGRRRRKDSVNIDELVVTVNNLEISPNKVIPSELALFESSFDVIAMLKQLTDEQRAF